MILKLFSLLAYLSISQPASNTGEIVVNIDNIKSNKGVFIVALFKNEDTFLKKSFQSKTLSPEEVKKPISFKGIPDGQYAVSVIHDENENGELDTNWVGIPKEPFGFSKKTMGTFGPPSFKETCVQVQGDTQTTTVKMKNIL